jgi:phage anti-repressor protein
MGTINEIRKLSFDPKRQYLCSRIEKRVSAIGFINRLRFILESNCLVELAGRQWNKTVFEISGNFEKKIKLKAKEEMLNLMIRWFVLKVKQNFKSMNKNG